jgi:plastocyanin
MSNRSVRTALCLVSALVAAVCSTASAAEKTINITGNGPNAQFIEDGKDKQLNVVVNVGDTVRWKNGGDRTHTATSDVSVSSGNPLFDTMNIAAGNSVTVTFDQALYDAAVKATGSKSGDTLHLGYFCAKHPALMGGMLVLQPQNVK